MFQVELNSIQNRFHDVCWFEYVYKLNKMQVHDVTSFVEQNKHPGGKQMLYSMNCCDCTKQFNGYVYNHTNAARNLMSHMRIAKLLSFTNETHV